MKKIGIDARLYFKTGIGTYLQNLLHFIDNKNFSNEVFYVYLMDEDFDKVNFKNINIIKRKANFPWHSLSEQIGFLKMLNEDKLDLMHFTYFSYPALYLRRFIATFHDTTPLVFKTGKASTKNPILYLIKHFFFKIVVYFQINNAEVLITPTLTVKKQLVEMFGKNIEKKIVPIYEGVNYMITNTEENRGLAKKYQDFFVYVGNFYPHKNIERLISAYSKTNPKVTLVLIGPDDYFTERISNLLKQKKLENRIKIIKNPPLADLIFFYKNAKALIHPSLSEGFGLPIIESAHFGLPIIASNIDVFKELLKDEYLSFNPNNESDITEKINWFLKSNQKYKYENVLKKFSFEKMTETTLEIYRRLI